MKFNQIIIHYAEIGIKGNNRSFFEKKLQENIKKSLKQNGVNFDSVKRLTGRIIVSKEEGFDKEKLKDVIGNVMGIANYSFGIKINSDLEKMKEVALDILKEKDFKTFKIETKRSNKGFSMISTEINEEVGGHIIDNLNPKVDLDNPDETVYMEITDKDTYIYSDKYNGQGGLPVGSGSKALVLLSGGIDSPVAAYFSNKRGVENIFIHFHSYPYTNHSSIDKAKEVVQILNKFQHKSKLYLVPFAEIQKVILDKTPEPLRILLYRRFMLRIAEKIAEKEDAKVLFTGESIGQVSSQTLENISVVSESVDMPILRPLIGMDKIEIINIAKKIGTYDCSIKPCQDSCTWFMPSNPKTKAKISDIKNAEDVLSIDELVNEGLDSIEEELIQ
jgi:thiamine biosynthesis protein ThiI